MIRCILINIDLLPLERGCPQTGLGTYLITAARTPLNFLPFQYLNRLVNLQPQRVFESQVMDHLKLKMWTAHY